MRIYNVRSLKRRGYKPRTIPCIIEKEGEFYQIFKKYYDSIGDDAFMFDYTRQRVYQVLGKAGLFPHWLRHHRATYLVLDYGLSAAELKQFFNWSNSAPADNYVHLNVDNLIDKMVK